jgi:hypothetical protein
VVVTGGVDDGHEVCGSGGGVSGELVCNFGFGTDGGDVAGTRGFAAVEHTAVVFELAVDLERLGSRGTAGRLVVGDDDGNADDDTGGGATGVDRGFGKTGDDMLAKGGDSSHPSDGAIGNFAGDAEHQWSKRGDEDGKGLDSGELESGGHLEIFTVEVY